MEKARLTMAHDNSGMFVCLCLYLCQCLLCHFPLMCAHVYKTYNPWHFANIWEDIERTTLNVYARNERSRTRASKHRNWFSFWHFGLSAQENLHPLIKWFLIQNHKYLLRRSHFLQFRSSSSSIYQHRSEWKLKFNSKILS